MEPRRVTSPDGTSIAFASTGDGPALLLVHGTSGDRTRWRPLLPYLEPHATVFAMDRRGRGASGDGPTYDLERELEDVAAVIDAIAADAESPVDVYGHSLGGVCALGAATLTANVGRLVAYEGWRLQDPSAWALPSGIGDRIDALVAGADREGAMMAFLREILEMPDEDIAAFRSQPSWAARLAATHTITRELRAYLEVPFDPAQVSSIAAPTLLVVGSESPDPAADEVELVAAAFPNARVAVLDGQQHVADTLAPEVFAEPLLAFLMEPAITPTR
jgi:pimeloyl-ACP methyl ester carboxylesterase